MPWHSIHVHYHDQGVDDLILDAVRPAFASMAGAAERAYYVRHWRRGPHLRLNLRSDPERFTGALLPIAESVIGGYLSAHPSRAQSDPQALLPTHRRLAALELEEGPLLPWRPDNSLHVEPYDRRLHVLGSDAAADLLADYLATTTELAFAMTDHVRDGGQRLRVAFDLMTTTAHALSGAGIARGFISYRSHAEAFLCAWPEGRGKREKWDRLYRARADRLVERVRAVVAALDAGTDTGTGAVPFVGSWVAALRPVQTRGRQLIDTGELSMDHTPPGQSTAWAGMPSLVDTSPFHRRLQTSDEFMRRIRPSAAFAVYRLMLNYTYLQLTRLGVTPVERGLLCHFVANAVEDCYGCSAMELIGGRPAEAGPTDDGGGA